MKRIDTMSIRDILRHHHDLGLPRAEIAVAVSVSAGTVSNVLERAEAAGLSWPLPSDLDDGGLRARLYPPAPRESTYAQPDWDDVLGELRAKRKRHRVRATRRQLWKEYRDEAEAQVLFRTLFDDGFPGLFDAAAARIFNIIRSSPERRVGAHSV